MSYTISIRRLLELRHTVADRTLMDYLELTTSCRDAGQICTEQLRQRWRCSQSTVSRRLSAIHAAGLADITAGWGAYRVHELRLPEAVA